MYVFRLVEFVNKKCCVDSIVFFVLSCYCMLNWLKFGKAVLSETGQKVTASHGNLDEMLRKSIWCPESYGQSDPVNFRG